MWWKIVGTDLSLHVHANGAYFRGNAFAIAELIRDNNIMEPVARASLWSTIKRHEPRFDGVISLRIEGRRNQELGSGFHDVTIYLNPRKVKVEVDISDLRDASEETTECIVFEQKQPKTKGERVEFKFEKALTHAKTGSFFTHGGWTSGLTGEISVKRNSGYSPLSADDGVGGVAEDGLSLGWSHQTTQCTPISHRVSFEEKRNITINNSIPQQESSVVMRITTKEKTWQNARVRVLKENDECIEEHVTTFTVMQYSSEIILTGQL